MGLGRVRVYHFSGFRMGSVGTKVGFFPSGFGFSGLDTHHYYVVVSALDILFSSNHNIHKNSYGLCFWASDPSIDRFY